MEELDLEISNARSKLDELIEKKNMMLAEENSKFSKYLILSDINKKDYEHYFSDICIERANSIEVIYIYFKDNHKISVYMALYDINPKLNSWRIYFDNKFLWVSHRNLEYPEELIDDILPLIGCDYEELKTILFDIVSIIRKPIY